MIYQTKKLLKSGTNIFGTLTLLPILLSIRDILSVNAATTPQLCHHAKQSSPTTQPGYNRTILAKLNRLLHITCTLDNLNGVVKHKTLHRDFRLALIILCVWLNIDADARIPLCQCSRWHIIFINNLNELYPTLLGCKVAILLIDLPAVK